MKSQCRLCLQIKELQLSHFIPRFVFNWAKSSSPTSYLRNSKTPNKRIQDGEKQYLLCSDCEQRLSVWENEFSKKIFLPLHKSDGKIISLKYGDWAMKFAVSVSWRTLLYHKQFESELLSRLNEKQLVSVNRAFEVWRQFLLGNRPNPGEHEQHILLFDIIESNTFPDLSPFINRYFLRGIEMDLAWSDRIVLTYTKMNRIGLFGFVQVDESNKWVGTKLHVQEGEIGSQTYRIPDYILGYLNDRANKVSDLRSMSHKQNQKILETLMKDLDKLGDSEVFRATIQDVNLSGKKAFGKP